MLIWLNSNNTPHLVMFVSCSPSWATKEGQALQARPFLTKSSPFNEGSFNPHLSLPFPFLSSTKEPSIKQTSYNSSGRYYKCQGLGCKALKCPNCTVITLDEYEAIQEELEEWDKDLCLMEGIEEVMEEDGGELLVLRRTLSGFKSN